jgi:putative DNA primase/helicase
VPRDGTRQKGKAVSSVHHQDEHVHIHIIANDLHIAPEENNVALPSDDHTNQTSRPTPLPVSLNPIPDELKGLHQWVVWQYEVNEQGKWTKVPYNPARPHIKAKAGQPTTWSTFDKACALLDRFDGIGLELTPNDPYTGVDLDDCRDPETGNIQPWAQDIIDRLQSYTEVSPSGEGIRIWIRGKLPTSGRRRTGDIEMYDDVRYLTITGARLNDLPAEIMDRQEEIDVLHAEIFKAEIKDQGPEAGVVVDVVDHTKGWTDDELLERALAANNGEKFATVWGGDISAYGDDDSSADQALCNLLAFWTRDPERIDRLFRRSKLYREKWERKDYRDRTITNALSLVKESWTTPTHMIELPKDIAQWQFSSVVLRVSAVDLLDRMRDHLSARIVYTNVDALAKTKESNRPAIKNALKEILGSKISLKEIDKGINAHNAETAGVGDDPASLGRKIMQMKHFAKDHGEKLYCYSDGAYRDDGRAIVEHLGLSIMEKAKISEYWDKKLSNDVVKYVTIKAGELWDRPPMDRINLLNGILDLETMKLLPHTPEYRSSIMLPVRYHPKAQCPHIDRFIAEIFPEDAISVAYEIAGWLLTPYIDLQKAILLQGPGGNGKSVFLELLMRLLGKENVSGVSLHRLENNRFDVAQLVGKLANICPDIPDLDLNTTSMFKTLVGGDQKIYAERKMEHGFHFAPFARLIFSGNTFPRSRDLTMAFFDRWLVIRFTRMFRGNSELQVPASVLLGRMTTADELSGFLNKALEVLPKVHRFGITEAPSMIEAMAEYRASLQNSSDKPEFWLAGNTEWSSGAVISSRELYEEYCLDCCGAPATERTFAEAVKKVYWEHDYEMSTKQRAYQGRQRVWCWVGIRKKE